eukprot:CAMPEP_0197530092 /NCGR_PEP_ID=MMETSP1318-20131121/30612_1 /TAXON_ID=552666 /ORGANISM="Partenskyella glossopodia, Strain RCC365" /LENGTH=333 /DNA_ID=CAMNT_0043085777 /DNA_START=183 /DNA_END=1185 /DNA_ORIENTATION=+
MAAAATTTTGKNIKAQTKSWLGGSHVGRELSFHKQQQQVSGKKTKSSGTSTSISDSPGAKRGLKSLARAFGELALAGVIVLGTCLPSSVVSAKEFDMMAGKTAFDSKKYLGTWYEVASMKKGFAGAGQEDCHCTQGMYAMDKKRNRILVNTFCAHGNPDGRVSGIMGVVKCMGMSEMPGEQGMMRETFLESCKLRFPAVPFIPAEPYDIIATDYKTYAIVQGSKDKSFVQIYSRKPKPGRTFIQNAKNKLKSRGFDVEGINDTPQDCDSKMVGKMMVKTMQDKMENDPMDSEPMKMPNPPKLEGSIELDTKTPLYVFTELKDLAKLIYESVAT